MTIVLILVFSTFNSWKKTTGGSINNDTGIFISISGTDSYSGTAYGILYNTYAASAGTLSSSFPTGDATRNLCPAGWRLPTGGQTEGTGEFSALYDHYRSFYKMRAPVASGGAAFALAGTFSTSTPLQTGSQGQYMSMTRNVSIDYILNIDNNIYPNSTSMTYFGKSIRCIVNI